MKSKRRVPISRRRKPEAIFRKIHRKKKTEGLKQDEYYPGIYTEKKEKVKKQTPRKKRPKIKKLLIKKRAKKRNELNLNVLNLNNLKKKAKQDIFKFGRSFIKFNVSKKDIYRRMKNRRIKFLKLRSKFFKLKGVERARFKLGLIELKVTEQKLKGIEARAKKEDYKLAKLLKALRTKRKKEPEEELPAGKYKVKLEQLYYKPQFRLYKKKIKYNTFKHIKIKKYNTLKSIKKKSYEMFEEPTSALRNKDVFKPSKIIVKKREIKNERSSLLFKALINFISIMKFSQFFRNLSMNNVENIFIVFNHFPFFKSFWLRVARYLLADIFIPRKYLSDLLTTVEYTFKLQYELKKNIFSYKENETIFITLLSLIQKSFLNYKTSKIEYYLSEILKLRKKQLAWLIFVMYKLSDLFLTSNKGKFNIYYVYFMVIDQFVELKEKAQDKLNQTDQLLNFYLEYKTLYQKLIDLKIDYEKPVFKGIRRWSSDIIKEISFRKYLSFFLIYIYIFHLFNFIYFQFLLFSFISFSFFKVLQKQVNKLCGFVIFLLYVQIFLYCFNLLKVKLIELDFLDEIGRQLLKIKLSTLKEFKANFKTIDKILKRKKRLGLKRSLKLRKIFFKAREKQKEKKSGSLKIYKAMEGQLFKITKKLLEMKKLLETKAMEEQLFKTIKKLLEMKRKIENKEEFKPKPRKLFKFKFELKKKEEIKPKEKNLSKEQLILSLLEERIKLKSTKETTRKTKWKAHLKAEIEFAPLLFRNNVRKKKKKFYYKKSQFYIQKLRKRVNSLRKINRVRAYNLPTNRKKYYRRQKYQYIDENFISFYRQV
jgi:hypothetical protein